MIRGQVLGGARVMPTEEIFAAALRVQESPSSSSVPPSTKVSVLVVTGGGGGSSKPSGKGVASGKSQNSFPPWKYCGKMSHPTEKCWKEFRNPGWVLAVAGGSRGLLHSFPRRPHPPLPRSAIFRLPSLRPSSHISRPLVLPPCTLYHRLPPVSLRWPATLHLMLKGMHLLHVCLLSLLLIIYLGLLTQALWPI